MNNLLKFLFLDFLLWYCFLLK